MQQLRGIDLDNAIFMLQERHDLTDVQTSLLLKADTAYLQDREEESACYVAMINDIDNGKVFDSIK